MIPSWLLWGLVGLGGAALAALALMGAIVLWIIIKVTDQI